MRETICQICGTLFRIRQHNNVLCSPDCQHENKMAKNRLRTNKNRTRVYDPEKQREYMRRYRLRHPDKINSHNQRHRERRMAQEATLPELERERLRMKRNEYARQYARRRLMLNPEIASKKREYMREYGRTWMRRASIALKVLTELGINVEEYDAR